jgi:hypothetical protein
MSSESKKTSVEEKDGKEEKQEEAISKDNADDNRRPTNNSSNDLVIDEGFPALNTFRVNNKSNKGDDTNKNTDIFPKFSFASFPSALTINKEQQSNIIHDCDLTFTARTKEDSDAYSSGATFFIPASMKPRCALEDLAIKIFQTHTKGLVPGKHYDVERSGAEWWTLVLDTASSSNNDATASSNDDDEEDDEVGMHFDADYGLEEQLPNYMLHPRVATVTYLSNAGVPTFIMNKKSPSPTDIEKQSLNGSIDEGWISCPMFGKHIGFDGRLLHGAIGTFLSKDSKQASSSNDNDDDRATKRRKVGEDGETKPISTDTNSQRITFMVNVWINHCPIDAEVIDDDLCSKMKTYWESDKLENNGSKLKGDSNYEKPLKWSLDNIENQNKLSTKEVSLGKGETDITETIDSVICNREVTINFRSSAETLQAIARESHECEGKSLAVQFKGKALDLVVGNIAADSDSEDEG